MNIKLLLPAFSLLVVMLCSCGGNSEKSSAAPKQKSASTEVQGEMPMDTIMSYYGQSYLDSIPQSSDTTFLIDGELYTLHFEQKLDGTDTVYYDEPYVKNKKVHVTRYSGRDVKYTFRLLNSRGLLVWRNDFYKNYFMKELGSIVAQSNMHLPTFETNLTSTNKIVLTQYFAVPQGDSGVEGILFFDKNGASELKFHRLYGSGGGDCEVTYSEDESYLLTCSEIITPSGKSVSIKRDYSTIAGTMFIGPDHVFVSYVFDADTSALGGRLYNKYGKVVKEIEFEGYSGALGYNLPFAYSKKHGIYYYVDDQNDCFLTIPEKSPASLKRIPYSKSRKVTNDANTESIITIETEVNIHKFEINARGEIIAHQMSGYDSEWKFYDELDY